MPWITKKTTQLDFFEGEKTKSYRVYIEPEREEGWQDKALKTVSFGGGVQSMALMVLAARGIIDYKIFLFSNVGDDSEHPNTLKYLDEYAIPFAKNNGLDLHILYKTGKYRSLMDKIQRLESSLPIPVRMNNSAAPGNRSCTYDFKIAVIAAWLKKNGSTKAIPAITALGISKDEIGRARPTSGIDHQTLTYPLLDLRLTRDDCKKIIASAGIPVPPKSSCYFCPYHSPSEWRRMRQEEPELFARSADLEDLLNERRKKIYNPSTKSIGKDPVWLSGALKPLRESFLPMVLEPWEQTAMEFESELSCSPFVCSGGV